MYHLFCQSYTTIYYFLFGLSFLFILYYQFDVVIFTFFTYLTIDVLYVT